MTCFEWWYVVGCICFTGGSVAKSSFWIRWMYLLMAGMATIEASAYTPGGVRGRPYGMLKRFPIACWLVTTEPGGGSTIGATGALYGTCWGPYEVPQLLATGMAGGGSCNGGIIVSEASGMTIGVAGLSARG